MKKHAENNHSNLAGTMASVLIVLAVISIMWLTMFMTYSSRL